MARRISVIGALVVAAVLVGGAVAAQSVQRFSDVPADHPQADAIDWAAEVGLTVGYGDGTFRPSTPLSKDHALIFMERFYDNVLEADQSDEFTRGDMMTLLQAVAGDDSYRWSVIGEFHDWTPTETQAKRILAERWPYITDTIIAIDTQYPDTEGLAARCGSWGPGHVVGCAHASYNLGLLGPTVSENLAIHLHEYTHVLHGLLLNYDRPVWNYDYCWGLGDGNCSSSPREHVAEAVSMALTSGWCIDRTATGRCLDAVPHVDEWLTVAQPIMDWLTWAFAQRAAEGDDYVLEEWRWTFDDWDNFYVETGG